VAYKTAACFWWNQFSGAAPFTQPPGVSTQGNMVICLVNSYTGSSTSEWLCIVGARTTIANAAYSFLHPWTQKGNMAVRLKKLHESAQARYEKSRDGLVTSVAQQQPVLTGELPQHFKQCNTHVIHGQESCGCEVAV